MASEGEERDREPRSQPVHVGIEEPPNIPPPQQQGKVTANQEQAQGSGYESSADTQGSEQYSLQRHGTFHMI